MNHSPLSSSESPFGPSQGRLSDVFCLDTEVDFLNHGSFGACPRAVLDRQSELREQLERQPVAFFVRRFPDLLDQARANLAEFVGADERDLVCTSNATEAVNTVLRSLEFEPGDELLCTDHVYGACRNALTFITERYRARVVVVPVPFPIANPDHIVQAIVEAVSPRTRVALIDHVTSATGLIMPIESIVRALGERGIDTLIDGAHAPGMVELRLEQLGCAYYTGNCHKWLCAPKGAAFLYVRRDRQSGIHPLTISHGYAHRRDGRSAFQSEFDWTGTRDPTAFLCVPYAIAHIASLVAGGWPEVRRRNHDLVVRARSLLCDALGVESPCPNDMLGSLAALPLPDASADAHACAPGCDPLQVTLVDDHRIEVPIITWPAPPRRLVRISAQLYNHEAQYRRLANVLTAILK